MSYKRPPPNAFRWTDLARSDRESQRARQQPTDAKQPTPEQPRTEPPKRTP